nr:hypothetical protein [uncultured bacterium]
MKTSDTETKKTLAELLTAYGVKVHARFFGVFREAADKKTGEPGWPHLEFDVTVERGKDKIKTPYKLGTGHIRPMPKLLRLETHAMRSVHEALLKNPHARIKPEYEAEERAVYEAAARHIKLAPKPADVMHSLLLDGAAYFDGLTFEDWCAEYDMGTDSRKAEAAYRQCDETGRKLTRMFTPEQLAALREAAAEY